MKYFKNMKLMLYILFFATGAGSLILEVAWTKIGTVILGSTVSAATVVLCCYMFGMAVGAWYFGKRADLLPVNLLRRYSCLLFGIAICSWANLSVFYMDAAPLFRRIPSMGMSILFCCAMLLPTLLMGGTLPVVSKYLSTCGNTTRLAIHISGLYGINIIGAATGALCGGFYCLEHFGITGSSIAASCWYLCAGGIAFSMHRAVSQSPAAGQQKKASLMPAGEVEGRSSRIKNMLLVLSGLGGCALFSYEMLYSRGLSLFWNSTLYSFSIVIATFLAGSGCGSACAAVIAHPHTTPSKTVKDARYFYLCIALVGTGIAVMGSLMLWPHSVSTVAQVLRGSPTEIWLKTLSAKAMASVLLMFMPSFFLGALVVFIIKTYTGRTTTGKDIGVLSAINTLGSIAGACIAGFILIPLTGAFNGFLITTAVLFTTAVICIVLCLSYLSRIQVASLFGLIVAGIFLILVTRSPYRSKQDERVLYYKEGATATVKVIDAPDGTRRLLCNSREEGNTGLDPIRYARLEAYVPLLLHPSPFRVMLLGLGTGITAGEIVHFPALRSLHCVEISPEIARGSDYFRQENRSALKNRKCTLALTDGRHYLRTTREMYDLIIVGLVHPGNNVGTLYSGQFYTLGRSHLEKGGLFCQWLSLTQCTEPAVQTVLATFLRVFPQVSVWIVGSGRLMAVIGGDMRGGIDFAQLRNRFVRTDSLKHTLKNIVCLSPYTLASWYVMGNAGIDSYCGKNRKVNTDNRPSFEYITSKMVENVTPTAFIHLPNLLAKRMPVRDLFQRISSEDRIVLNRYIQSREHLLRGGMLNAQGKEMQSFEEFQKALRIHPRNEDAQYLLGVSRLHENRILETLHMHPHDLHAHQELAYIYCQTRRFDKAAALLEKLCAKRPEPVAYFTLARVYEEKGDIPQAITCYEKLLAVDPGNMGVQQRLQFLKTIPQVSQEP